MLELNENKCASVLRVKEHWKFAAGKTKERKSGQSLIRSLSLVKFYFLTSLSEEKNLPKQYILTDIFFQTNKI